MHEATASSKNGTAGQPPNFLRRSKENVFVLSVEVGTAHLSFA